MGKQTAPRVVTITTEDLIARLETTLAELDALAPAPRVHLDRQAVVSLVMLCREALTHQLTALKDYERELRAARADGSDTGGSGA